MNPLKYAVTFACYNQVDYTRQCIDSMIKQGADLSRVIVVDNGSTDHTREYLQQIPLGELILNQTNLGCGVAWNQGALALQAEWTIIMNNDVLVSPHWIEHLIHTAEKNNLKIISPSLIEGPLDYDFNDFSMQASKTMQDSLRLDDKHAVCLAVHQSVWMEIGYFQPTPSLLGYEDTLFFHEAKKAGLTMGMTGAAWLHHYGSVTQTAMKKEQGLSQNEDLAYRYNYRLLKQSWLERKFKKFNQKNQQKKWRQQEMARYGMYMYGIRENNDFSWQ